jgi:hypothetical protein
MLRIFIYILLIVILLCLILIIKKKVNSLNTKKFIQQYLNLNSVSIDEYESGDLLFFVSKDSEVMWLPYYFTHVGIVVKKNDKIYVLDADPLLKGKYLIELEEYIKKYCGNIYLFKFFWNENDKKNILNNLDIIMNETLNIVDEASVFDLLKTIFNSHLTCVGLATKIIFNKENNIIIPDELIINLKDKINYVKRIKKQDINNNCYHSHGLFNPFTAKHIIQKS